MADDNNVDINGKFDTSDVESGVARLESLFGNFSSGIDLPDDKVRLLVSSLDRINQHGVMGALNASIQVGASLWNEQVESVKSATQAAKFYNVELELAVKRHEDMKKANGFQGGERDEEAIKELGAAEQGFAKKGTWTRWFEELGARARDTVEGTDTDAERAKEGQKALRRGEDIRKNNEEHAERMRRIQEGIDGDMEAIAQEDDARAKRRLDETRKRMHKEEEHVRNEDRMTEEQFEANRRFTRGAGGRGIHFAKDDTGGGFSSSAEDVFRKISAGAASGDDERQAREQAEATRKEIVAQQAETNRIMADSNVIQGKVLSAVEAGGGLA